MVIGIGERLGVLLFVKIRKEQNVKRVFNDCAVVAVCKGHGNVTEQLDPNDQTVIGVEGGARTKGIAL